MFSRRVLALAARSTRQLTRPLLHPQLQPRSPVSQAPFSTSRYLKADAPPEADPEMVRIQPPVPGCYVKHANSPGSEEQQLH